MAVSNFKHSHYLMRFKLPFTEAKEKAEARLFIKKIKRSANSVDVGSITKDGDGIAIISDYRTDGHVKLDILQSLPEGGKLYITPLFDIQISDMTEFKLGTAVQS